MSILEVNDVSIHYMTGDFKDIGLKEYVVRKLKGNYRVNEFWADRNISFTLDKGEILGIIGTNGAGKSTLLKAVSGIMEPTKGHVKRKGNIAALLELASGFDGDLTVRENTYLRGAMLGYTRNFMDEKYDDIINFAELQEFQDRPFRQLSSGMKARLAFSIASLVQPDLLILDEVLSVGDGAFRKKSEEKMREIIRGGAATILVSHSIEQVKHLCTKVLWLEKGQQIAFGNTAIICDLYQQYLNRTLSMGQIREELLKTGNCNRESKGDASLRSCEKRAKLWLHRSPGKVPIPKKLEKEKHFFTKKSDVKRLLTIYSLLFLVTFLLAYSPFLLDEKSFIWIYDGRTQHYPTLVYIGRYLRQIILNIFHGKLSIPLFDMNLAMGGDVIATLNYYGFGNPLYLLSAFVPTHYTEYLYNILIVVRLYLAGLSFIALCRHHKKEVPYALMGALIYVFSGYAIFAAVRHPYFVEPMFQLPLLLIGIDLVIQKRKPFIFIFSVFYSALCGFYFLYMMTIMLGVYTLVHFFDCYEENRVREFISMAKRIIATYSLGIGLAAVMFIPSVINFLASGRSGGATEHNYFFYGRSFYGNAAAKLIAPPGTWDVLSLGAISLLALVLLLTRKKQYRSLKILLLVAVAIYMLPLGGHIMNGFSYPSQRWTFGFVLLLSYILVEMLPILINLNKRQQLLCFGILLLYGTVIFFEPQSRNVYNVVGVAMLAVTLLILCIFGEKNQEKNGSRIVVLACTLLVIGNVGINAIYCFAKDQNNYVGAFTVKGTETKNIETAIERDAEPYLAAKAGRFDSSSFSRNVGVVWRVPTMYIYWSMINKNAVEFYIKTENTAQRDKSFALFGTNERTNIEELFSTKYFIEKAEKTQNVPYGYRLLKETDSGNLIYENQYALPWGYTYDSYISSDSVSEMNGLEISEAMLQHIVLEENIPIKRGDVKSDIQAIPYTIKNGKDIKWNDKVLTIGKNNADMTLEFQMPPNTECYLRLQGLNINNSGQSNLNVTVNCADVQKSIVAASPSTSWYYGREDYLTNLGYSEEERATCTIKFSKKGEYKLDDIQLFALPMDKYPEQVEALRAEPLENIVWETNKVSGTVDLSKNKILCMSIPYSEGWSAKVDGQKAEILRGNYMFMAVPLTAGHHEIEFSYCTPGLKVGIICSALSILVVIMLLKKYRRCSSRDGAQSEKIDIEFHADDYGLFPAQSREILDCCQRGCLNAVSVMPNSPHLAACLEQLCGIGSDVKVTVHLNLIEGHSLCAPERVNRLTDRDGVFTAAFGRLLLAGFLPGKGELRQQLCEELRAQLRAVQGLVPPGVRLRVDAHAHYHMLPIVFDSLVQVLQEEHMDVEYIRFPEERLGLYLQVLGRLEGVKLINLVKVIVLKILSVRNRRKYKEYLAPMEKRLFLGVALSGHMTEGNVRALLPGARKKAAAEGWGIELLAHPGGVYEPQDISQLTHPDDKVFLTSDNRKREKEMFCSDLVEWTRERGGALCK